MRAADDRSTSPAASPRFAPPGPGEWRRLADHFPRPLTAEYQRIYRETCTPGIAVYMASYGVVARTLDVAVVAGHPYVSPVPIFGPRAPRSAPPRVLVWAMSRILPEFRRRHRAARWALEQRPWRAVAERWFDTERDTWRARAARLEAVEPGRLDDAGLADHLRDCRALAVAGYLRHFELHGDDLLPLGLLIARCDEWGLDPKAATAALTGASGAPHASEVSPWMLVSGYDLDSSAWVELGASPDRWSPPRSAPSPRDWPTLVPDEHRREFEVLVADARAAARLRDDNGAITGAWPMGLLRRAMLAVGRRHLGTDAELAVEATVDELVSILSGRPAVTEAELDERRAVRLGTGASEAPLRLGPEVPFPPLHALPRPLALIAAAQLAVAAHSFTGDAAVGVGSAPYTGRAVVVDDPVTAIDIAEPGDVIVTTATSPAWNAILAQAGALVTTNGGLASHAAVTARDLGIAAVIGDTTAVARLRTGFVVTVDPLRAEVTVVSTESTPTNAVE